MKVAVVIPALNEEENIGSVLSEIPRELIHSIYVADNGSTDRTAEIAREAGAVVVEAPIKGYGFACLSALEQLPPEIDTIAFMDADGSDCPAQLGELLEPLRLGQAELVIGSRIRGEREPGAMIWHAVFGNMLATFFIRLLYGVQVTDLGPFRVIRRDVLDSLNMERAAFRWTTEMIVKAARYPYRIVEIPTDYRCRGGESKISGTLVGSVRAAYSILQTVFRYVRWTPERR